MEVSKHFTGVALEVFPAAEFQKTDERGRWTLLSLMGHVVGLKRGLTHLLLLGLVLQVVALASPLYIQWIVDHALASEDRNLITVLGTGFLLLVILQTSIGALRSWITTVLANSLNFQWYSNTFAHLLRLPLVFFEKRHIGDIISRFGAINTIQTALTTQLIEGIIDGALVFVTLGAMFLYSTLLSGVAGLAVAVYALVRLALFRSMKNATVEQVVKLAVQQTLFLESARGVQALRLFNRTGVRRIVWMNALAEQMNAEIRIAKLAISYHAANTLLFGAERVAVIWLAAVAALNNELSIGMLFAFLSYKDQFSQRVTSLVDKLFDLRMLRIQGERLADIVMSPPEDEGVTNEVQIASIAPSIELRNLCYRYDDTGPYIINNVSLHIPPGQCLAITGSSGCGKTTLIKLLLGLLEPVEGEILVGGLRLKELGLQNYRQLTGAVMQDDFLFAGSIADNISFFDPSENRARVEECARMAAIHEEIASMPMGYFTLVGDLGTGLSGGQKQRILLARALYHSPRILVTDEATSHLDVDNERSINIAIRALPITRLIAAHRPDTIEMADRVIHMHHGAVVKDSSNPL